MIGRDNLKELLSVAASIIAIIVAILSVLKWIKYQKESNRLFRRSTIKKISRNIVDIDTLESAARLSYVMLRLDQIPQVGNWGVTIDRYIELNFPRNRKVLATRKKYIRQGSITHTAEALRTLSFLPATWLSIDPTPIKSWIDTKDRYGHIEVDLETWLEVSKDAELAKKIRHTVTACLSLLRLEPYFYPRRRRRETRKWVRDRIQFLLSYQKVWHAEPEMIHTRVYLIELLNEARKQKIYTKVKPDQKEQIVKGLGLLLDPISVDDPIWYYPAQAETSIFYTLLIIVRLLSVPEVWENEHWQEKINASLDRIATISKDSGGVPMGIGSKEEKYTTPDLGTTGLFLEALLLAGRYIYNNKDEHNPVNIIVRLLQNYQTSTMNAETHTWGPFLFLHMFIKTRRARLKRFVREVDPLLRRLQSDLFKQGELDDKVLNDIGALCGMDQAIKYLIKRDIEPRYKYLRRT